MNKAKVIPSIVSPLSGKLLRYVPKKLLVHVTDAYHDSDGYWINFDDSVDTKYDPFMNCGTIHEDTIRDVRARLARCVILSEQK